MVIFQDSIFVEMELFYREANSYQAIVMILHCNTWTVRILTSYNMETSETSAWIYQSTYTKLLQMFNCYDLYIHC